MVLDVDFSGPECCSFVNLYFRRGLGHILRFIYNALNNIKGPCNGALLEGKSTLETYIHLCDVN